MARSRLILALPLAAIGAAAAIVGVTVANRADAPPLPPATEHVLLGAPNPSGPTTRGVFLRDPRGQVERIAAGGHLVAWTVRTPADRLRTTNEDIDRESPLTLPEASKVVVVDERDGAPLTIDLGARYVEAMRFQRGAGGPAQPQLAVRSCSSQTKSSCRDELLDLPGSAPLKIERRSAGREATLALSGRTDLGRRLIIGTRPRRQHGKRACLPRLSVASLDGTNRRRLRSLLPATVSYPVCTGLDDVLLAGRYAFVWVSGKDPDKSLNGTTVFGIDIDAGEAARWREVQAPYRYSDASAGVEIGPAVTDSALYWEELNEDDTTYSLELVALPRDVRHTTVYGKTATTSKPVAPGVKYACQVAATDDAIYELANPRCKPWPGFDHGGGAIRRIVHPTFTPATD